ncbi:AraC family transcriptional regulator [Blastococcus sp. SYSU D00922]
MLTGYPGLATSLGVNPADLMARVGLHLADLDLPDRWIPAAPVARLLGLSAAESGCADFGLRLAASRHLGTLGPISVVLRDQPDLRSVLDLLVRYDHAYDESTHLRLRESGDVATIDVWLEFGEPAPGDEIHDLAMGAVAGIVRALLGQDWWPLRACFVRRAPPDPAPWHRLFGPSVVFGAAFTGLVLDPADLATPLVSADPSLRPYTQEYLGAVVTPEEPSSSDVAEVEEAIELLLPLGRHSVDDVSRHLGLTPRGLQRSLAERGETFSSVAHATRARLAERYLPNERYSLTEVSQLLGFEAPSAFSRWFRQRFGTTPKDWRRAALDR